MKETRAFNSIVKIGSKVVGETDTIKLTKYAAALTVLHSALLVLSIEPKKYTRLVTLADSMIND